MHPTQLLFLYPLQMSVFIEQAKLIRCPYDPNHKVSEARYNFHVHECLKKHRGNLEQCKYNAGHYVRPGEMQEHLRICEDYLHTFQNMKKHYYEQIISGMRQRNQAPQCEPTESTVANENMRYTPPPQQAMSPQPGPSRRRSPSPPPLAQQRDVPEFGHMRYQPRGPSVPMQGFQPSFPPGSPVSPFESDLPGPSAFNGTTVNPGFTLLKAIDWYKLSRVETFEPLTKFQVQTLTKGMRKKYHNYHIKWQEWKNNTNGTVLP